MFRLSLLLIALAGFAALVALPDVSPRATVPADDRAARVYGDAPALVVARAFRAPIRPAVAVGDVLTENLSQEAEEEEEEADDLLTITTAEGEVIRVATQIPPARVGTALVRIEAEDINAEARRLEAANARARAAVAERATTTFAAAAPAPGDLVYATGAYINLRSGPSTGYPAVGFMNYGMAAERLEALPGGWSRIRVLESGAEGFMFSAYLSERAP